MAISTKLMRMQIAFFKSVNKDFNLETARANQAKLGSLTASAHRSKVCYDTKIFKGFIGEWVAPKTQVLDGVILYLHGGGYVTGDIDFAKGFGTTLAALNGIQVFCAAYRLAPEFPYPAAVEDAVTSYRYLLTKGYAAEQIILCGESAGGGLSFALTLKLKELGLPLPGGIIAISPWTDLKSLGKSYERNREVDPSMTKERLAYYAAQYSSDVDNPIVSPLYGNLTGFPSTLIFVGGDEVMLDDSRLFHKKLLRSGCKSELTITPHMWHCYILYGVEETKKDMERISLFLKEITDEAKRTTVDAT